jgi:hypothetical protein
MGRTTAVARIIDKRRPGHDSLRSNAHGASGAPQQTDALFVEEVLAATRHTARAAVDMKDRKELQPTGKGCPSTTLVRGAPPASQGATSPGPQGDHTSTGSAAKHTGDADFSEMLLEGVRAAVFERSSHLSKDFAAFSKIKW